MKRIVIACIAACFLIALGGEQHVWAAQDDEPYLIKVNRYYNTITIYEKDVDGSYTKPIKAMACSVGAAGTQTLTGTFRTQEKYRWKALIGDVWGQYSTRIVGGILFHSVYYYQYNNPGTLATRQYNKLGSAASHGCIRLTVEDAKWIYDHCPIGTTVTIYDDKNSPGPLGKPKTITLPLHVCWDPTDPNDNNPYKDSMPVISGVRNLTVAYGDEADLLKEIKAISSLGTDITASVVVEGNVDVYTSGNYQITYAVTDEFMRTAREEITVTVDDLPTKPVFQGIREKYINGDVTLDRAFALDGVEVYSANQKQNKDIIEVSIKQIDEKTYSISYYTCIGDQSTLEETKFYIDKEPPLLSGIMNRVLNKGQIPDRAFALYYVSASDEGMELSKEDIEVTIDKNMDGSFFITYEVTDKAQNVTTQYALFTYLEF